MQSKTLALALLLAFAEARFNQEQLPIPAIQSVTSGGSPGVAATLAGSAINSLLGAANPCLKLQKADEIIDQLGTGADAVAAAIGLVAAEQNFNPFTADRPFICGDPTLPKSEVLRGITPLVDPAVDGSEAANALSARSKTTPFDATGKSVAQVMADNGFATLVAKDLAGNVVEIGAGDGGGGGDVEAEMPAEEAPVEEAPVETDVEEVITQTFVPVASSTAPACDAVTTFITVTRDATASTTAAPTETAAPEIPVVDDDNEVEAPAETPDDNNNAIDGVSFGLCTPTIDFLPGRNGRKAAEFTFQATDPLVNKGQQEALNPNIITNRIYDQLTNVCEANQAAKDLCQQTKATVLASGLRDGSVVETWNAALGFAGAVPPAGPVEEAPARGGNSGNGNGNNGSGNGNGNGNGGVADGAADFGLCSPTIDFLPGRNGRKATEFTFQATDPQISSIQSEALNPNIITNRICDELTNQCEANQAAKDLC